METLLEYLNSKQLTKLYNRENGGFNNVIGTLYNVIQSVARSGAKFLKQGRRDTTWNDRFGKVHSFNFMGSTIDPRSELKRLLSIDTTVAKFCTITFDEQFVYLEFTVKM